jgi:transposase
MASNPIDSDEPPELFGPYEETVEYAEPIVDFSFLDNETISTPPPPEPPEEKPVERQVDYLDLPGLRTLSDPVIGKTRILVRAVQLLPATCPACGADSDKVKANGVRRQLLLDEPRGPLGVRIDLRRRIYRCRACNTSKFAPLDCVAEGRRMTRRLELHIQRKSLQRPFREIALETGVSPKTVRQIFSDYVRELELEREEKCPLPEVLGLDGVYIKSKERAILTDPTRGLVIDLLPTVQAVKLGKAMESRPGHERVKVVTIDMAKGLRSAVKYAFPQAVIVIDRYHIQRMANESVDRVRHRLHREIKRTRAEVAMCHRKLLRKHPGQLTPAERKLKKKYFGWFPELKLAYETKEAFFDLWNAEGSFAAKFRYKEWLTSCPPEVRSDFQPLMTAMKNWGEYIFNYFDHKHTNAFTEASNRKIKDIQREGRAGSFKTVRAKAIFGTLMRQELKAAREMEPGHAKRRGTPRAKGPRPKVEEDYSELLLRRLPGGLQLSLF